MQARAGDEESDRERGAAERVGDLVPDFWQGQVQNIERKPDRTGPDQRIFDHGHDDGANRLPFRRGAMRKHRDAEHIHQRNDCDHRDGGERKAGVAIEVRGDRERHIGLPADGALEHRGEGRAIDGKPQQGQGAGQDTTATSQVPRATARRRRRRPALV
jgi:hypothetical protein